MTDHRNNSRHNDWQMVNTERRARQPRDVVPIVEAVLLSVFVALLIFLAGTDFGVCQ